MSYVIWGGAGVGVSLARHLAMTSSASTLILASRRAAAHAQALRGTLPSAVAVHGYDVDATDVDAVEAVAATIAQVHGGPVAGFVYALGNIPLAPSRRVSGSDLLTTFSLNTAAAILAFKHAAAGLAAGSTSPVAPPGAVFFSTIAATTGFTNHVAIAAAKGGLESAVRTLAVEVAPKVRVNAVAPSLTLSPLGASIASSDAAKKSLGEAHPLARLGTVHDLVQAAAFLLDGSRSGWMTGQVVHVDGGRSTVRPR